MSAGIVLRRSCDECIEVTRHQATAPRENVDMWITIGILEAALAQDAPRLPIIPGFRTVEERAPRTHPRHIMACRKGNKTKDTQS